MTDPFQAICVLVGACTFAAAVGGSFVFGVATVCRWMEWAPINTTVNVNNYGGASGILLPGSPQVTEGDRQ